MLARTPEEAETLFGQLAAQGDLDALVALYEPQAVLVRRDRTMVSGQAAIRDAFKDLAAMRPRFTMSVTHVVPAGDDLAVLYTDWTMTATRPDGAAIDRSGKALDVVRRQRDGSWRFVIDDPFAR